MAGDWWHVQVSPAALPRPCAVGFERWQWPPIQSEPYTTRGFFFAVFGSLPLKDHRCMNEGRCVHPGLSNRRSAFQHQPPSPAAGPSSRSLGALSVCTMAPGPRVKALRGVRAEWLKRAPKSRHRIGRCSLLHDYVLLSSSLFDAVRIHPSFRSRGPRPHTTTFSSAPTHTSPSTAKSAPI